MFNANKPDICEEKDFPDGLGTLPLHVGRWDRLETRGQPPVRRADSHVLRHKADTVHHVSQTKTEFDNLKSDFLSALLITSLPLPLKINARFIRRICFSTPPLPSRLRAIRCHFDHRSLAKREEEAKKKHISQLSAATLFAEQLTSTSLYLSNLI